MWFCEYVIVSVIINHVYVMSNLLKSKQLYNYDIMCSLPRTLRIY